MKKIGFTEWGYLLPGGSATTILSVMIFTCIKVPDTVLLVLVEYLVFLVDCLVLSICALVRLSESFKLIAEHPPAMRETPRWRKS